VHVLCYGAGAIGSLVGGRLSHRHAATVTLLARRSHVAAIRTWGLILDGPEGRIVCKGIDSITSLADLVAPPDLILLTVKSYQTPDAVADLEGWLRGGARILSLQNGVGNEERIAAVAGADHTYAGAITINATVYAPGRVREHTHAGGIALAPVAPGHDLSAVAAMFLQAGFRTVVTGDYRALKWSKLLLNIIGNASAAILDLSPRVIVGDARLFHLEREAFLEAGRVMDALGLPVVPLPGYPVPLLRAAMRAPEVLARVLLRRPIARGRGEKIPSLWEDIERGRSQSEVEVLNAAVTREGARLGIPTPVNATLTDVLAGLASGRYARSAFRQNPDALLSMVGHAARA
jgi:2-dehydropantoate 2-reductase